MRIEEYVNFINNIPGGALRYSADDDESIDFINNGLIELYGCENESEFRALTGNSFRGMVHPDDLDRVEREIWTQANVDGNDKVEYRIVRQNGSVCWVMDCGRLVTDENGMRWFYVVLLNSDDMMAREHSLRHQAQIDPLVEIYNRSAALRIIRERLTDNASEARHMLIIVDIDDFKEINDTFGHPVGDTVLVRTAELLQSSFRPDDVIGRLGGDEFIVFLSTVKSVERICQRIKNMCNSSLTNKFGETGISKVTFSAGATCSRHPSESFDDMYKRADEALYEAKRAGKSKFFLLE